MFIVEKVKTEISGGYITYYWTKDRTYKLFQNAEKRVNDLHHQGINARMIEDKRK